MGLAAIGAFIGAALMLILSALGFVHERRTTPQTEVFPKLTTPVKASTS
jgi:hypothetical protein